MTSVQQGGSVVHGDVLCNTMLPATPPVPEHPPRWDSLLLRGEVNQDSRWQLVGVCSWVYKRKKENHMKKEREECHTDRLCALLDQSDNNLARNSKADRIIISHSDLPLLTYQSINHILFE